MSQDEIWNEALTLITVGGDTTSLALSATFFCLSRNAGAYAALASEIRTAFSTLDSIRRGPALSSCHYLRACLDEAMRLAPPASGAFWREIATAPTSIDGTMVPVGCEVGVGTATRSTFQIHSHFSRTVFMILPRFAWLPQCPLRTEGQLPMRTM